MNAYDDDLESLVVGGMGMVCLESEFVLAVSTTPTLTPTTSPDRSASLSHPQVIVFRSVFTCFYLFLLLPHVNVIVVFSWFRRDDLGRVFLPLLACSGSYLSQVDVDVSWVCSYGTLSGGLTLTRPPITLLLCSLLKPHSNLNVELEHPRS